jgi:hypothetical protein
MVKRQKRTKKAAKRSYINNATEGLRMEEALQEWRDAVEGGAPVTVSGLAHRHNIPRTTLRDRLQREREGLGQPQVEGKQALKAEEEEAIIQTILKRASLKKPMKLLQIRAAATSLLKARKPGAKALTKQWLLGFTRRHPEIKLRKARQLNALRARAMKKATVTQYFDRLQEVIAEENIGAHDIYNFDETEIKVFDEKRDRGRVIVPREYKRADTKAFTAYSGHITFGITIAADGTTHIPLTIYSGKTLRAWMAEETLDGQLVAVSEKGWITTEIFKEYLQHFKEKVGDRKVLLLVDGHVTREDASVLTYCAEKNIILFKLPAHTTHELQPLDKVVMPAFKKKLYALVEEWTAEKEGEGNMTKEELQEIMATAYNSTMTSSTIKSAFRKTGV